MRKSLLAFLFALLLAGSVFADPTPGDVKTASAGGTYSTLTITGLVVGGDDRGIAVTIADEGDVNLTYSTVTWNGGAEALSQVRTQTAGGNRELAIWYLANPTATTANIVITLSGTQTNGTLLATATALNGVKNEAPSLHNGGSCGSCNTGSLNLTSVEDDSLLLMAIQSTSHVHTYTHGAGQTELSDFGLATGSGNSHATSYEVKAIAGLETLTSNCSPSCTATNLLYVAIGIKPSAAAPPPAVTRRRQPNHTFR